jgi:hypothetical protein
VSSSPVPQWLRHWLPFRAQTAAARAASNCPKLPLLGLFRTGTNYTRTLLETHYQVRVTYSQYGWKHGLLPTYTQDSGMALPQAAPLVVVKHPLATLDSLFSYHRDVGRNLRSSAQDLPEFLRSRIVYFCEQAAVSPEYRYSNPIQLWNGVVWNHIRFAQSQGGLVVRYEDLLAQPQATCERIAAHFQLQRLAHSTDITAVAHVARRMDDNPRKRTRYVTDQPFGKTQHFLSGEFFKRYSAQDLHFAAQELDAELLRELGYSPHPLS